MKYHANTNQKKKLEWLTISVSEKADFISRNIISDKEDNFKMIRGSIHQEYIILNIR